MSVFATHRAEFQNEMWVLEYCVRKMKRERFKSAIEAFDAIHRNDPEKIIPGNEEVAKSWYYHKRLSHWVEQMSETPSEALLLAARCQHLRRKAIPRTRFPMDRAGYRSWRTALAEFHAREAAEILLRVGYSEAVTKRVGELLRKERLKLDPEVQLFEDAICLVFLEIDLLDFSKKHDEVKLSKILGRTWKKMSPKGHRLALELAKELPQEIEALMLQAVHSSNSLVSPGEKTA